MYVTGSFPWIFNDSNQPQIELLAWIDLLSRLISESSDRTDLPEACDCMLKVV